MNHWDLYGSGNCRSNLDIQQSFEFSFFEKEKNSSVVNTNTVNKFDSILPANIWPVGELSEIKSEKHEEIFQLLLPLLSKLSSEKRWITLISPPVGIDKQFFIDHGIDVSHVLLIHPKNCVDDTVTMNKALKNGTSGIVILWSSHFKSRFVAQWRKSVKQGNCHGVIINHNGFKHNSRSVALTLNIESSHHVVSISSAKRFGQNCKIHTDELVSNGSICEASSISSSEELLQLVN